MRLLQKDGMPSEPGPCQGSSASTIWSSVALLGHKSEAGHHRIAGLNRGYVVNAAQFPATQARANSSGLGSHL